MIDKDVSKSYACIFVKDIAVDVRIGLLPSEQIQAQRVLVNIEMFVNASYIAQANEQTILDYALIYDTVKSWALRPHIHLIETYVQEVLEFSFGFEPVQACRVSIAKPDIFPHAERAGVEVFMRRAEYERD